MTIFRRIWRTFDDRTGLSTLLGPALDHPVPNTTGLVGWSYALGSGVLITFVLQVITGIALSSAYIPSTGSAFESLTFITDQALFGRLLRGMHNYGAWAMIIFIGLHMAQTYIVGAYKYPREVNWLTGVVLLLLTLAMGFTGQLLRWDQIAYWSVFVLAQQVARVPFFGSGLTELVLAGNTVNGATLSRFYALHVFFIPALIFIFVGMHLWLVLHTGVSDPPQPGVPVEPAHERRRYQAVLRRNGVPFWPDAAWRDVVLGVVTIVVITVLAIVPGPPPLEKPPDPTVLEAYPRPDWYFTWIFAVLALVPQGYEDLIIIGAPVLLGLLLIALPLVANKGERAPQRRPWAVAIVVSALVMIGSLYVVGEIAPWSPRFEAEVATDGSSGPPAGAALFNAYGCVTCHQVQGIGGLAGPALSAAGGRLTRSQLTIRIMAGGNGMPAYAGILSEEELNAILDYLQVQQSPAPQYPAERGRGTQN